MSYVLTTAENELGVVVATSATSGNSRVFYKLFFLLSLRDLYTYSFYVVEKRRNMKFNPLTPGNLA